MKNLNLRIARALALALAIAVAAVAGAALPAAAVQVPTSVTKVTTTNVAPITCSPEEDSCELGFVANGGNGYVMFRLPDSQWVRASLVPGANNTHIPPITCRYYNSCVLDFVGVVQGGIGGAYWRAQQASTPNGPQVRLTLVNGA